MPGSYAGYSPKQLRFLPDDLLDVLTKRVELGGRSGVMRGKPKRSTVDRELPIDTGPNSAGLSIRY